MSDVLVLDVGHGNCAIVRDADAVAVIDAPIGAQLIETLDSLGITHVESACVSHSDADHLQGILALLTSSRITVGVLYVNADADKTSNAWQDLLAAVEVATRRSTFKPYTSLTASTPGTIAVGDIALRIVSPSPALGLSGVGGKFGGGPPNSANTLSAAIMVERTPGKGLLLASDMDESGLRTAIESCADLNASVLVYPHHGGLPGSGKVQEFVQALMEAVAPTQVLISNGRNRFSNPRKEVVDSLLEAGCRLSCTQLAKACGDPADNSHLEAWPAAGRDQKISCAGSMAFELRDTGAVRPVESDAAFEAFIGGKVATPMCRRAVVPAVDAGP